MSRYSYITSFLLVVVGSFIIIDKRYIKSDTIDNFQFDSVVYSEITRSISDFRIPDSTDYGFFFVANILNCTDCSNEIYDYINFTSSTIPDKDISYSLFLHGSDSSLVEDYVRSSGILSDLDNYRFINLNLKPVSQAFLETSFNKSTCYLYIYHKKYDSLIAVITLPSVRNSTLEAKRKALSKLIR